MPSVIGTDSGSGVNVAANYLKARPSTRFSTRQLAFFQIDVANIHVNPEYADSLFSKVVRGVQVVAEIYAVGTPYSGSVIVVVAADTTTGEDQVYNDMAQAMSTAIGNGASVTPVGLYGNGFLSWSHNVTVNAGQHVANHGDGIEVPTGGTGNQKPPYENESVAYLD